MLVLYEVYSWLRIEVRGGVERSFDNAMEVIDLERSFGLFNEARVQAAVIDWDWFIRAWNVFHGLAHFAVPPIILILLWRRRSPGYRRWRNVGGWILVFGLLGFAAYPMTPPRLLPASYGFVDTGDTVGGVGPIGKSQPIDEGNAFAEVPSLHVAFALWAALAVRGLTRRRWARWAWFVYPVAMTYATIVTGKHYWIDAVGGAAVVGAGWLIETRRAEPLPAEA